VTCSHDWKHRPDASGYNAQRYECSLCHEWAYRMWTRRGLCAMRPYKPARFEADPSWFDVDRPDHRDEQERGKRMLGNRMVLDPRRLEE